MNLGETSASPWVFETVNVKAECEHLMMTTFKSHACRCKPGNTKDTAVCHHHVIRRHVICHGGEGIGKYTDCKGRGLG